MIATSEAPIIANPQTGLKQPHTLENAGLHPDATRWGMVLLRELKDSALTFSRPRIPANTFWPFRPFPTMYPDPSGNADTGGVINLQKSNKPAEQIVYAQIKSGEGNIVFLDFVKLSQLEDEALVAQIAEIVAQPKANPTCKYTFELGRHCTNCWLEYLESEDIATKIFQSFEYDERAREAAIDTVTLLRSGLREALDRANRTLADSLRDIDDNTKGKRSMSPADYDFIRHTHSQMPKYRTSIDPASDIKSLVELMSQQKGQAIDREAVMAMINEGLAGKDVELQAMAKENAELRSQLEAKVETCGAETAAGTPCKNKKGACKSHGESQ